LSEVTNVLKGIKFCGRLQGVDSAAKARRNMENMGMVRRNVELTN
jgi:hypothetical protein